MNTTSTKKLTLAKQIEKRKQEQIKIQLTKSVEFKQKTSLFEDVFLTHCSLPEINRSEIDTSTVFLGHRLNLPLMVAAITGGSKESEKINKNIAKACEKLGIAMGLGSMKAMLVEPSLSYSYQIRDVAPRIFLAGNIGAHDLVYFSPKVLKEALKKIGANILAVHLNPAQELVQKEGETSYKGILELIKRYAQELPIYVKETGQGISGDVAKKLSSARIQAIDVGGSGGTSWTGIEYLRRGLENGPLWDWGNPTALALIETKQNTKLPIIATGGIRTGEEIAKAITLGADICGTALPILKTSAVDFDTAWEALSRYEKEFGDIMFLLGAASIVDLKKVKPIITGKLRELVSS